MLMGISCCGGVGSATSLPEQEISAAQANHAICLNDTFIIYLFIFVSRRGPASFTRDPFLLFLSFDRVL
jgi:hypothetical protein